METSTRPESPAIGMYMIQEEGAEWVAYEAYTGRRIESGTLLAVLQSRINALAQGVIVLKNADVPGGLTEKAEVVIIHYYQGLITGATYGANETHFRALDKDVAILATGGYVPFWAWCEYPNPIQEMRGIHTQMRTYNQDIWDVFGGVAIVEVTDEQTDLAVTGQIIGHRTEVYCYNPVAAAAYVYDIAIGYHATFLALGAQVTVTNWYGAYIANPVGAGAITTGYGIHIENLTKPTTVAAIRIEGADNPGRIWWSSGAQIGQGGYTNLEVKPHGNIPDTREHMLSTSKDAFGADGQVTGVLTEETVYSCVIGGGEVRTNDALRFTVAGDIAGVNDVKTIRFKVGAVVIATITEAAGETDDWAFEITMQNRNATNAQVWLIRMYQAAAFEAGMDLVAFTAIDFTVNQTINVTGQLANIGDAITKRMGIIEYLTSHQV